jgi:phage-related protein
MASPTDAVAGAMSELGISLTDSNGNMKSLSTVMSETRGAFSKLTETEKTHYASVLAGKTGMSGLLAVVNSADSDFNKVTEAINNSTGACKQMYDVANDNLQGQLTILKSTIESLAISFGELMLPKVKAMTAGLQKLAEKFNSLTTEQKESVLKWATIIASIGPAIMIFGKLVLTVGKVVSAVGKFGALLKSFGSLGAIITSPAGIVIGVIALIAGAVFLIYKNWDKLKPYFEKVKAWFLSTFAKVKEIVMTYLPPAIEKVKEAFFKALPVIQGIIEKVVAKVTPVIKAIVAEAKRLIPIIKEDLTKAFNIALPVLKKVVSVCIDVGKHLFGAINSAWQSVKPVLSALGELFGVIFDKIVEKASKMYEYVKPFIMMLVDAWISNFEKIAPALSFIFGLIGENVKAFIDFVKINFNGLMGVLKGIIQFITGVFSGDWRKAWEGVKSIFSSIFDTFAELAKKPINAVISVINGAISRINGIGVSVPSWVPVIGGKSFKVNIPTIPTLAKGTDNWKGGIVQISERGGEIVDLPQGSRVYPHDKSVQKAYADGAKSCGGSSITIAKLADQIIVREEADIDRIADKLAQKLESVSKNLGGGELGYLY